MRWALVVGLLLCVLEQAYGQDLNLCAPELIPMFNAINQADACSYYTGYNRSQCINAISDRSNPEYCTTAQIGPGLGGCKKFTSVADIFCTSIGMEARSVTAEGIRLIPIEQEKTKHTGFEGLFLYTPEFYSSEGCRSFVRDVRQADPDALSLYTEAVNKLCTEKTESSDDTDNLAIGLGVGLGVGLPLVGVITYFLVKRSKAPKATESLEPFLS